ncbi:MAG: ferritin-like domain-containing protein [Methanosarcinales archaeon]|nr:MAG: ferritin-like domain-containing protein [Methanosarcinales archaeon]
MHTPSTSARAAQTTHTLITLQALLHALVHAESYAIDLSWDMIVRFGYDASLWSRAAARLAPGAGAGASSDEAAGSCLEAVMPDQFFHDWVRVAHEEAQHFSKWRDRLRDMGVEYGDMVEHDGLWDSATDTAHSLLARLAVVHMVHEARGLDTYLLAKARFEKAGDERCLAIIEVNHREEITHVAAGRKWLTFLCEEQGADPISTYHDLVRMYFFGPLKPPFNDASRMAAGMSPEWYMPLALPSPDVVVDKVTDIAAK